MDGQFTDLCVVENLEQILATLRHEMGNCLNSLKITLDVLRENYEVFDDRKKRDYLERGSELVARQQRMVDAMKTYARFNVEEQEEMEFNPFWERFVEGVSKRLQGTGVAFTHELEASSSMPLAHPVSLQQVMMNLMDNAVEALEGVGEPRIELTASADEKTMMVVVRDNGAGIHNSELSKVYAPLFTTKPGKMGMGLPIACKLLSKMGGRIDISSFPGRGTEIRLELRSEQRRKEKDRSKQNGFSGGM